MQTITILGATGSIGTSTLAVIAQNPHAYQVTALTADSNVDKMFALCQTWQPKYAVMTNENAAAQLMNRLASVGSQTKVYAGIEGQCHVASLAEVKIVMAAIVGAAGLLPTMAAVKAGKRILLANKEALVMSGELFINATKEYGAQLLPVDSEHNAIFQCLAPELQQDIGRCDLSAHGVSHILLTGSGGPFRYTDVNALEDVTPEMAIAHPNWSMGPKISVDSATMMNKGLEFIEARWLFNAKQDQLKVLIHPQSVIHSMVQYQDGSVIAQMGEPDMCTPIAHALAYPQRINAGVSALDFTKLSELTFLEADFNRYPCLKLAMDACYMSQVATTSLNAANEVAVEAFLNQKISFNQIAKVNESVMNKVASSSIHLTSDLVDSNQIVGINQTNDLASLLEIDNISRIYASEALKANL